ncbi:FAD-dependent oxidoreductase [Vibrio sp. CAIM 722]|uniref:FAD-dependent oxidoreductase n=1 Tax=Vibrio eleionomae TaxID=2653505 RepID=A0A7X4RV97_9VIBR|nr:FAD-dependent oxidoreductase [Vibrio eleionomae]MZI94102.1 FAD-dependent oxidoreductase [Vibrio eleionomae]
METNEIREVDVCVIGAGPAGMSAAISSAQHGASVVLLDEQPSPGGKIYRAISTLGKKYGDILGEDYVKGSQLVEAFNSSGVDYNANSTLWRIEDQTLFWSCKGQAYQLKAKRIIIANGALERPFPFPGWTLPGAMTAGSGQIMMKTSGLVAKESVLVGTGPLLYLLGVQMLKAGAPPKAIVDTQTFNRYVSASKYAFNALRGAKYIVKGLKLLSILRKAGVVHYSNASNIEAVGDASVEGIRFSIKGQPKQIACMTLLSHIGVTPNTHLTRALGAEHEWDHIQQCWKPKLDSFYNSSVSHIAVAGDGGGIGGALVAELQGKVVGLHAVRQLNLIQDEVYSEQVQQINQSIAAESAIRPFLDQLYAPPEQAFNPQDETVICRCENITAKEIRARLDIGVQGSNQLKAFTRCGMGPCQGRYCGQIIPSMISAHQHIPVQNVESFHIRFPIKPLKLGELASLTPYRQSYMAKYKLKEEINEHD